jgi:SAM-dependent methyltransferase
VRHSREQAARILAVASEVMQEARPEDYRLHKLWRTLASIQALALAHGLAGKMGAYVQAGPFKGMRLTNEAMTCVFGPALLGIYETELQPVIETAIAADYKRIVNIGCSYGYYAVGLARRMRDVKVFAFDISNDCQRKCRDMAAANNVSDRVTVGGEFKGEDFAAYADGQKTLLIVDIEGAEKELLDPARYPALAPFDLIVELHDVFVPGISKTILDRFTPTHDVTIVPNNPAMLYDLSSIVADKTAYIDPFDHLLLSWEERDGPTPWAVMKSKNQK